MSEQNQIQNIFFSKETISGINKILLQDSTLQNISREGKQEVINLLIKNMKAVYKNLETSKINKSNITSIFDQFKKISIVHTIGDIKKLNISMKYQQNTSEKKFERDFNSNPNKGNIIMDRPEPTKQSNLQQMQNMRVSHKQEQYSGFGGDMGNFESSLDDAFRPIVDSLTDQDKFNDYDTGRSIDDVKSRMHSVQQSRDNELNMRPQRPSTPDFLKPKKTSIRVDSDNDRGTSESTTNQKQNNTVPDFKNINQSEFNNGFHGLSNDTCGDLFSLDNIDKPLIDENIIEDNASFDERLQRLQSERDNVGQIEQSQKNIDFTDVNFSPTMNDNRINNRISHIQNEQNYQNSNISREQNYQNSNQQNRSGKYDDIKSSIKSARININEDNQKMIQYQQLMEKMQNENNHLKSIIREFESEQGNEIEKINKIKEQIAIEFKNLNLKSEEIDTKESGLNLKEIELNKKEVEIRQLIANYDYLFKSSHLQFEVSNNENKASYIWTTNIIKNVIGIKLMSYSLPIPRFNIEEHKNNVFTFKVNGDEFSVVLSTGKYSIDELIHILNIKLSKINTKLSIKVNNEQRVIFESSDENDNLEIIPTLMSKENLGWVFSAKTGHSHLSDKIWDLRIDDKVYLYLNNLSEEIPFGILYFNGQSVSQFKFHDPFDITQLEIVFKDSKGMNYNFYGLPHSLSFLIEKIN